MKNISTLIGDKRKKPKDQKKTTLKMPQRKVRKNGDESMKNLLT